MRTVRFLAGGLVGLSSISLPGRALAQFTVGTWLRTDAAGKGITMTVEPCCNGGRRLIYRIPMAGQPVMTMTVDSPLNGTDAPTLVGGKPSGQTMAITRVDDRHYTAVVKLNGKPAGTYSGTFSADAKTLTVEGVIESAKVKVTETWVRQ